MWEYVQEYTRRLRSIPLRFWLVWFLFWWLAGYLIVKSVGVY